MKKWVSQLLVIMLVLSSFQLNVAALSYGELPKLISYSLGNDVYTIGEQIDVEIRTESNGSNQFWVKMDVLTPVSGERVELNFTKQDEGVYKATIDVTEAWEVGRYAMASISFTDSSNNKRFYYNQGNDEQWFEIDYPASHKTPPLFDHVEAASINLFEQVSESFDIVVTDDLPLKSAQATFVNDQEETVVLSSTNVTSNGFSFELHHRDFPKGDRQWELQKLSISDIKDASVTVTEGLDVVVRTLGNVEPIDAIVVQENEYWQDRTINQDVYILKQSSLTIGPNVTIAGDIYVYGKLWIMQNLELKGRVRTYYLQEGYSLPGVRGVTVVHPSNTFIHDLVDTGSRAYDPLPFRLKVTEVPGEEGMVFVSGATIPLYYLFVNGKAFDILPNGVFGLKMAMPEDQRFYFSMTDNFWRIYEWSHRVTATDLPVFIDSVPIRISGFTEGRKYYRYITPRFEEGTATLNGQPYTSGTTIKEPGKYTLELDDRFGNKASKQFVIDRTPPVIDHIKHRQVTNQDVFIHYNEGRATLNGRRIYNNTTVRENGHYTLRVTDQAGNVKVREFTIDTVRPDRPTLLTVTDQSTRVTGRAEKGALVYITYNGQTYRTRVSSRTGIYRYYLNTTRVGATVSVKVQDRAGNFSLPRSMQVLKTFRTFTVNPVRSYQTVITGTGTHGASVRAYVGSKLIGRSGGNSLGMYTMYIPPQKVGTPITIYISKRGYQTIKKTIIVTR